MISPGTLARALCECTGMLLAAHQRVLCICGRECHRNCSEVIDGAFHGPACARKAREGEKIHAAVPAADRATGALSGNSK